MRCRRGDLSRNRRGRARPVSRRPCAAVLRSASRRASLYVSSVLYPGQFRSSLLSFLNMRLLLVLLLALFLLLFLARWPTRLHALDRGAHLGEPLVGQAIQRRQPGAQQLALLHGDPKPDATALEN